MYSIVVSRPKNERYYNENKIKILIDGQLRGKIGQGESLTVELSDGEHTCRATTTFNMGSNEIIVNPQKETVIEVSVNPNFNFTPTAAFTAVPFFLIVFFNYNNVRVRITLGVLMAATILWFMRMLIKGKTEAIDIKEKD